MIVKQPNGLYARFSSIVDDFTDLNLSKRQAYRLCRQTMGIAQAQDAISAANSDSVVLYPGEEMPEAQAGLRRWQRCLNTIRIIHGERVANTRAVDGSHA
jgi:hypothetical protein